MLGENELYVEVTPEEIMVVDKDEHMSYFFEPDLIMATEMIWLLSAGRRVAVEVSGAGHTLLQRLKWNGVRARGIRWTPAG